MTANIGEEINQAGEIPAYTRFNVVSKGAEKNLYFGAITDPGNTVSDVRFAGQAYRLALVNMTNAGKALKVASKANTLNKSNEKSLVISPIPFFGKNPGDLELLTAGLIMNDCAKQLNALGHDTKLATDGTGYYIVMPAQEDVKGLTFTLSNTLDYFRKLAARINNSRFSVSQDQLRVLAGMKPTNDLDSFIDNVKVKLGVS